MIDIESIADLELLRESVDLECKLAAGRDGKGAVPEDFWPTYSSFANTEGGMVLLGVKEKHGQFSIEGIADIAKVREMTGLHPFDLTRMLQNLVRDGFLEAHNPGRGAVYCLPGAALPKPEEVFGDGSEHSVPTSAHLPGSSAHLAGDAASDDQRDASGRLLSDQLDAPAIDSLEKLVPAFREKLEKLAAEPRTKGKLPVETMKEVVLAVCSGQYVTLSCLAQLVNRDSDAFRQQYLKPLAKDGKLRLAFPTAPTHAKQGHPAAEFDHFFSHPLHFARHTAAEVAERGGCPLDARSLHFLEI